MWEKKWDVYVYGDVNIDIIIPGVEKLPSPGQEDEVGEMGTFVGGGAALFAMGAGKLGLRTVLQGEVGQDLYGSWIREALVGSGVSDVKLKSVCTQKTGISLSFSGKADRSFLTFRGTNEGIDIEKIDMDYVGEARHIHMTGYEGMKNHGKYLRMLRQVKEQTQASVSLDVGWDATGIWPQDIYELFPYIDILFMNETESIHYSRKEDAREAAFDLAGYCGMAVIKLGKEGSLAVCGKDIYRAEGYLVDAVDTTGAGDSFNAGFIYAYLNGLSPRECLKHGNGCGALSVTALGGNTGFPNLEELKAFLKGW